MPYDEELAARIRHALSHERSITEKKMFGGLAFFLNGNMCVGVTNKGELMLRVGAERQEELLEREWAKPMDFTGKPMRGFLFVEPEGVEAEADLEEWLGEALSFVSTLNAK